MIYFSDYPLDFIDNHNQDLYLCHSGFEYTMAVVYLMKDANLDASGIPPDGQNRIVDILDRSNLMNDMVMDSAHYVKGLEQMHSPEIVIDVMVTMDD